MLQLGRSPQGIVMGIANIVFYIALFRWKKWGFYGLLGTTIVSSAISLSLGVPIVHVIFGVVGFLILCVVLGTGADPFWTAVGSRQSSRLCSKSQKGLYVTLSESKI